MKRIYQIQKKSEDWKKNCFYCYINMHREYCFTNQRSSWEQILYLFFYKFAQNAIFSFRFQHIFIFCTVFRLFMHIFQHHVMTQQLDLIALNVRENGLLWRHHKQTSCFFHFCCRIYTTTNTLSSYLSLHILETFFSVVELMINFNVPTWERWEDCVVNFHTFQYEMYC